MTVNTTVNVTSITMGAFTGTIDFSAHNNNVTLQTFNGSGIGTRTLNMGNGTWTLTGTNTNIWTFSNASNLTLNANSSTISITDTAVTLKTFIGGGKTFATISIAAGVLANLGPVQFTGSITIGTLLVAAPACVVWSTGTTYTISNAYTITGSGSAPVSFMSGQVGAQATVSVASGTATLSWTAIRDLVFSGGATFTASNSLDLGNNSGITITPASGSGGFPVLGGPLT